MVYAPLAAPCKNRAMLQRSRLCKNRAMLRRVTLAARRGSPGPMH
jgi:hypothetical protein